LKVLWRTLIFCECLILVFLVFAVASFIILIKAEVYSIPSLAARLAAVAFCCSFCGLATKTTAKGVNYS